MGFCLSLCGFGLFFLSDYNDWRLGRKGLKLCFPLGALLLALGTVLEARQGTPLVHGWLRGLLFALGATSAGVRHKPYATGYPVAAPDFPEAAIFLCLRCFF